jgi:hypothetical protein
MCPLLPFFLEELTTISFSPLYKLCEIYPIILLFPKVYEKFYLNT